MNSLANDRVAYLKIDPQMSPAGMMRISDEVLERNISGRTIGDGKVPGPGTEKLTDGYAKPVDFDFMAQYLRHLA